MPRKRAPRFPNRPPKPAAEPDFPSLGELERFSQTSLHQWLVAKTRLDAFNRAFHADLESLRQRDSPKLLDALRSQARPPLEFDGWCRIVDYRYSLAPLSVAGSVKTEGGRFNIGAALNPGAFTAFPALYLAEDYDTALRERLGTSTTKSKALEPLELALRTPGSFTQVRVRGRIEQLLDVGDLNSLTAFASIVKTYPLPRQILQKARQLGLRQSAWLIRSASTLQRQLLHPNWRMLPMQFDLPSNSQIFGRLAAAAGLHGLLFPSARQRGKQCLALFPQNWVESASYVEVVDRAPESATCTRIDGATKEIW